MCALCTMYIHESPPGTFILPNYDVVVLALGLYVYVQCQPTVCIISLGRKHYVTFHPGVHCVNGTLGDTLLG